MAIEGGINIVSYFIYGYKGDKKKLLNKSSSYMEAVKTKEKWRKTGKYDKVDIEEPATNAKKAADKDFRDREKELKMAQRSEVIIKLKKQIATNDSQREILLNFVDRLSKAGEPKVEDIEII